MKHFCLDVHRCFIDILPLLHIRKSIDVLPLLHIRKPKSRRLSYSSIQQQKKRLSLVITYSQYRGATGCVRRLCVVHVIWAQ